MIPCPQCRVGDHDLCIGAGCECLTPLHDIMTGAIYDGQELVDAENETP